MEVIIDTIALADKIDSLKSATGSACVHFHKDDLIFRNQVQKYIIGPTIIGKPCGIWFVRGGEWLRFINENDMLYANRASVIDTSDCKIYEINTRDNLEKFMTSFPTYWITSIGVATKSPHVRSHMSPDDQLVIRANKKYVYDPKETLAQLEKKNLIIRRRDDGSHIHKLKKLSRFSDNDEIKRHEVVDWSAVAQLWDGFYVSKEVMAEPRDRQWIDVLDVESGCILNPLKIMGSKLIAEKVSMWKVIDDRVGGDIFDLSSTSIFAGGDDITDDITDAIMSSGDNNPFMGSIIGGFHSGSAITGGYDKNATLHDAVTSNLVPGVVSECSLSSMSGNGAPCMRTPMLAKVGAIVGASGSPAQILEVAKAKTNCTTERCVLGTLAPQLGEENVRQEVSSQLKVKGPTDGALLSNIDIDSVMQQWGAKWRDFYPHKFNMVNYARYSFRDGRVVTDSDSLAKISFADLFNRGFRTCACVINTDTYQGPGKHWMALFADARSTNPSIPWTVEFFNSSGNAPQPEYVNWMEKTRSQMEEIVSIGGTSIPIKVIKVAHHRHQNSRSECGLYALFYIWARLNKVSYEYFQKNSVPDSNMFEFRQHLYDDPNRPTVRVFDWAQYQKNTKIEWE